MKKCGSLYQLLVPTLQASRIAHPSRNEQRRSPHTYVFNRHRTCIHKHIGIIVTVIETYPWASTVALLLTRIRVCETSKRQRTKRLCRHFLIYVVLSSSISTCYRRTIRAYLEERRHGKDIYKFREYKRKRIFFCYLSSASDSGGFVSESYIKTTWTILFVRICNPNALSIGIYNATSRESACYCCRLKIPYIIMSWISNPRQQITMLFWYQKNK